MSYGATPAAGELLLGSKKTFDDLGIKLGFRTAFSGSKTDPEWNYDLTWFEEHEGYTTRLPLILESEHQMSKDTVNLDY
jgi:hypothetical protein